MVDVLKINERGKWFGERIKKVEQKKFEEKNYAEK